MESVTLKRHISDEEKVQNDPESVVEEHQSTVAPASLLKALEYQCSNGSNYRTITPTRPTITTPISHPKKDKGTQQIQGWFVGKKDYYYNDHLTCYFAELAELSRQAKRELVMVTCTFNDENNQWLRDVDDRGQGRSMVQTITRSLEQNGWTTDSIVVLEECDTDVSLKQGEFKRLHIHVLTYGGTDDFERLKRILKPFSMQTRVQANWIDKRPYNAFDKLEEEQFGEMPFGKVDPSSNHWLNTYKTMDDHGRCWVHVEHPVCLRSADYLSKGLNKPIGRSRNFKLIGLEGAQQRRKAMYDAGRDIKAQR